MSENLVTDNSELQNEIKSVIFSIVDKIDPIETTRLDVTKNKFGIFTDLEILADCTCYQIKDNPDHKDYCSKEPAMDGSTEADSKVEDPPKVEEEDNASSQDDLSGTSNTTDLSGTSNTTDLSRTSNTTDLSGSSNTSDLSGTSKTTSSSANAGDSVKIQGKSKSMNFEPIKTDLVASPRATRSSQNPDFAAKHRKFLNSKLKRDADSDNSMQTNSTVKTYTSKDLIQRRKSQENLKDSNIVEKRKRESVASKVSESDEVESEQDSTAKKRKNLKNENYQPSMIDGEVDCYCWRCHRDGNVIPCETCPRVYHLRCIQLESVPSRGWICPECSTVLHAENIDTRSRAMRMLTLDQLCKLLQFAVNRMKGYEGSEEFAKPVDTQQFEHYRKFIVKPMDLSLLEENIKNNLYGSTEAFLADAKWILHNCVIFNTVQSKFTNVARALLKICRQEMLEIENCPDCYQNAHTRSSDSWFIEVCRKPHILVWAKLKGFPFWPAKAMTTNSENQVDVRFFGAHDRAWVPVNACYLYSKMPPVQNAKKKSNLEDCIQELEAHIKKLRDRFGSFEHAPYKTPYNPKKEDEQLALLLPNFDSKMSPSKRVGRLIHDRMRPSSTKNSPEKKEQDLKNEKSDQKEKTDQKKSAEKQLSEPKEKRKAKTPLSPSRCSKLKYQEHEDKTSIEESMTVDEPDDGFPTDESNTLSPPKFFISKLGLQKSNKGLISASNETKIAFVDKLQEKLSRLEKSSKESEESKNQEESSEKDTEMKSKAVIENKNKEVDKYADITFIKSVVVLHDLKNSKVLNEKLRNSRIKPDPDNENQTVEDVEMETDISNEEGINNEDNIIQLDSSPSSVGSVECLDERNSEVNKKKNNINNLVETIKERKSSTDGNVTEKNEKDNVNKVTVNESTVDILTINNDINKGIEEDKSVNKENQSDTLQSTGVVEISDENEVTSTRTDPEKVMLDSSEYPLVIIDEPGEDNMSSSSSVREIPISSTDSSKILKSCLEINDKPNMDKNRRKGKPAKVCSRESIDREECSVITRRHSVEHEGFREMVDVHTDSVLDEVSEKFSNKSKSVIDTHNDGVLDEVSGKYKRSKSLCDETNVTINVISDESTLNKKAPKEIRASVNLSKDVSLSVVGDCVPSTLDMECVSDSEDPVTIAQQHIRPTARKTLPRPVIRSQPQKRKSVEISEGIKIRSPQSLKAMSPPLFVPTSDPNKSNTLAPIKLHDGHPTDPSVQMMHSRNGQTQRILPPLHHKPNQNQGFAPGPLNAHLDRLSQKLSSRFRIMFEDILKELSVEGCTEAAVKGLQLEMERMQWRHRQEIAELKHNTDLIVMEVRASMESEKQRLLIEAKHKFEQEKELAIQETKCKQWCAFCRKEALLYCCWNTAYCSYPCQQNHWLQHMNVCAQNSLSPGNDNTKPVMRGSNGPAVLNSSAKAFSIQNPPQMHDVKSVNSQSGQDFDDNNNEDSINESLRIKAPRRKRCGECEGCSRVENCQSCRACLNLRSHQVCQKRRCSNIMYDRTINKKRHSAPNPTSMKMGVGSGFLPLNMPVINSGNRNMGPRPFGPVPQYMSMMHHQSPPGGFMPSYQHQVFMN